MRHSLFAAVAVAGIMVASAASAQMVHYTAKLAGTGSGSGDVFAMLDGKTFSYTVNYKGLTGPAVAAHFHDAATPGGNGPPIVPASNVGTSPIKGTATLTDSQIADLNAGKVYFNIHTAANPGGEIRGTLAKQ
ncbi:CHRD domain-containing protein [Phenylobacterium sp.]|uniref:CHRD domain-containing protein n=1 Tax=Phenylobacterium sp. TaxID=1871053 RepID=UPI0011FCA816|nr:CHRD domain-containing protein [Phenylobacterium sp.]THD63259.1 MAG: CHRD domain-containing protein [Phenylobacterium sp.]